MFKRYRFRSSASGFRRNFLFRGAGNVWTAARNRFYRIPPSRRGFAVILFLSVLVGLWLLSGYLHPKKNTNQLAVIKDPVIQVMSLVKKEVSQSIVGAGILEGDHVITLVAETNGQVEKILARKGQNVTRGTPLISFKPTGQQSLFENARTNFETVTVLHDEGIVSETEYQKAKADFEAARDAYRKEVIRAPFDGVFDENTVSADDTVSAGTVVGRFLRTDSLKVRLEVGERHIGALKAGQKATLALVNGSIMSATVSWVGRLADPQTHTIPLEINVSSPSEGWIPGISVVASIQTTPKSAYFVPFGAAVLDDSKKPVFKFLDEDHKVIESPIDIVEKTELGVWIDHVPPKALYIIVLGQGTLKDGQIVKDVFVRKNIVAVDPSV